MSIIPKFKHIIILIFIGFVFMPNVLLAEEKYLCVADQTVGFKYNKNSKGWEKTFFMADAKYIVWKEEGTNLFNVTKIGKKHPIFSGTFTNYGYLKCDGFVGSFEMNKNNGRYIFFFRYGYVSGEDDGENTPFIEIGKCSPY